jgi:hypothetical protein
VRIEEEILRKKRCHPKAIIVDGEPEWEVESILDKQVRRAGRGWSTKYLVRWKGWGPEHDSWELLRNLHNAKELVEEYEAKLRPANHPPY